MDRKHSRRPSMQVPNQIPRFSGTRRLFGWVGCRGGLRLASWPPVSLKEYKALRTRGCEQRFSLLLHSQPRHKRLPRISRRRPPKSRPRGQRTSASDMSAILFESHVVIRRRICPVPDSHKPHLSWLKLPMSSGPCWTNGENCSNQPGAIALLPPSSTAVRVVSLLSI